MNISDIDKTNDLILLDGNDNDIQAEQDPLYIFTTLQESYLQKPASDSVGKIVTRLDNTEADELSIQTLKKYVELGYPFSPTFFINKKRETENILAFTCFLLDFDNKDLENVISPDEALDMLYNQDIKPNFIYRTLSNTDSSPRFRIGFLLDKPIMIDSNTDIDSINSCYKLFQKFFSIKGKTVIDSKINAVSFFYGGTDFEILHEKPHDFEILYCFLDSFNNIYTKNNLSSPSPFQHSPTPLGRNGFTSIDIKDTQPKRPRELQGGSLTSASESTEKALEDFQQEEDAPLNIINYIETLELALKPSRLEELKARKPENAKQRNKEWGFILLSYNIHCFYDFLFCKKKFHHDELFRLATNIIPIKGGALLMKSVMINFSELHPENPYDPKKLDILKWVKKHKPHPYALSTFSEYEEDWKYGTLLNAIRNPSNKIFDNLDRECITLLTVDEARVLLDQYCTEAEASSQNRIIIKAPTGLGKTEALKSHFLDAYIGTKTNKLKNEIAERLDFITTTPDYPKFEDEQLKKDINKYDQIGLYQNSSKLIYDIADRSRKASNFDYLSAISYTDANNRCYGDQIIERFVTTHSRGIRDSGRFPQKTIVLDEDPMGDILNVKMAKIPDIAYLTKYDQQFQRELDYFISQEMHNLYKYETCLTLRDSYIRECEVDPNR
jgi:hypothetical protein